MQKFHKRSCKICSKELGVEGMKKLRLDANTFGNGYSISQLKEIIAKYEKILGRVATDHAL